MGITRSAVIDAPVDEVFTWFTRPGAFPRLIAPWIPVRIGTESTSLRDGTTVLELPVGLQFVAKHDPSAYVEGRRFVDEVSSDGVRSMPAGVLPWRNIHDFEPLGADRTRVSDVIETPVPEFALSKVTEFRYRRLAGDLAAHRRAFEAGFGPSTIAITGSSGLVGADLSAFLSTGGHRVIKLVRHEPAGENERQWDPQNPDPTLLDGVDAVVHLAGESIAGRFSAEHKKKIVDSRIEPTRLLAEAAAKAGVKTFVSASAVGFYGADRGDEELTEESPAPTKPDFLSDVVDRWEDAAQVAESETTRVVNVRTGIVQSPNGGTLKMLLPLFRLGLGGKLGDGKQWQPWVSIDDLVDIYHRALWDEGLSGPVNAVAPNVVRNDEYTKAFAKAVHRPAIVPVPAFGPALLLGKEGADDLAFASQRVRPTKLIERGHVFRYPEVFRALKTLLGG